MLSTLARSGLEPVAVEARAVDLLHAALTNFADCQGSIPVFLMQARLTFLCICYAEQLHLVPVVIVGIYGNETFAL